MGASRNVLNARAEVEAALSRWRASPSYPPNRRRAIVERALEGRRVREMYWRIRAALWSWEAFAAVRPGARAVLEVVIELARQEAFPWYVPVQADKVRRLARLSEGRFSTSVRELECLAITRPGRMAALTDRGGFPVWAMPGSSGANVRSLGELRDWPQWVVRYRRGIPWNRKRAAWWINYDLLCQTGRVLPGFEVSAETLSRTYQGRNVTMGPGAAVDDIDALRRQLERAASRDGPVPSVYLLGAALWEGPGLRFDDEGDEPKSGMNCSVRGARGGQRSVIAYDDNVDVK